MIRRSSSLRVRICHYLKEFISGANADTSLKKKGNVCLILMSLTSAHNAESLSVPLNLVISDGEGLVCQHQELRKGNGRKKEKEQKKELGEESVLIQVEEDERKAFGISDG